MPRIPYSKPSLSYSQQLQQLKDRGLNIESEKKALHLLENISYYRLSGYWYPMLAQPKSLHRFKEGASFNTAFKIYCFDREFRRLILGELEKIEVAIRAKIIYILSKNHGAFWFNHLPLFRNSYTYARTIEKFEKDFDDSREDFIIRFKEKYNNPLPPSWMMLEITSFGSLSFVYSNLKPGRDKRTIANYFGLNERTFESWIHSIIYVRNICAHHGRLWNRDYSIAANIPTSLPNTWIKITTLPNADPSFPPVNLNNKTYFFLSMIIYLLNTINPHHSFKIRLKNLLEEYPTIDIKSMGFPTGWEEEDLWK